MGSHTQHGTQHMTTWAHSALASQFCGAREGVQPHLDHQVSEWWKFPHRKPKCSYQGLNGPVIGQAIQCKINTRLSELILPLPVPYLWDKTHKYPRLSTNSHQPWHLISPTKSYTLFLREPVFCLARWTSTSPPGEPHFCLKTQLWGHHPSEK